MPVYIQLKPDSPGRERGGSKKQSSNSLPKASQVTASGMEQGNRLAVSRKRQVYGEHGEAIQSATHSLFDLGRQRQRNMPPGAIETPSSLSIRNDSRRSRKDTVRGSSTRRPIWGYEMVKQSFAPLARRWPLICSFRDPSRGSSRPSRWREAYRGPVCVFS